MFRARSWRGRCLECVAERVQQTEINNKKDGEEAHHRLLRLITDFTDSATLQFNEVKTFLRPPIDSGSLHLDLALSIGLASSSCSPSSIRAIRVCRICCRGLENPDRDAQS
ncbi:hypothetical protein N7539_002749 [Penicillium diatomitis]|uniref:Uncharacterized protein n=1 Tax=Penicillium diatomitis TaxID=2819901 RepID=A0A9W9XGI4_9EURO|nr:uncharacterized protein N7539_002749 [Penicillium diatomitis]KAJ5491182.1 hypothetical protein N7539_002749 [Penicillium diatomitis]